MKAVGIVLAGGTNDRVLELTRKRAIAAMPVAGSYRCIDYALSNMSNSHIRKVAVMTQYNSVSLNEHLNSSKWWDFGRKQGGLYVFTPTLTVDNEFWYRGTADAIYQNITFLKRCHEPYVVITGGDCVYKLDFNKVLDYHIEKNADLTIVCKTMEPGFDPSRYGVLRLDAEQRIQRMEQKPMEAFADTVSTGIYIIRRRTLIELLEKCISENRFDLVTDVLIPYIGQRACYGYMMEDYWSNISAVDAYYKTNMDFLKPEVRKYFNESPTIYSKVDDLAPAKYNPGAEVKNSLIASGCIINGTVENSILFKKVFVGNNVVIKNSIILNEVYIGDNCYIENCILESRDSIQEGSRYVGESKIRVVDEKSDKIGKSTHTV